MMDLKKKENDMKDPKFVKHKAIEHHEQHRTDVPDMPSKNEHAHESTTHENQKRSHHKEQDFSERKEERLK